MTEATEGDLIRALNDRLVEFKGGEWMGLIKLEGDSDFTPPADGIWIDVDTQFKRPKKIGSFVEGGHYRIQGNYEITVQVSVGGDILGARDLASALTRHFYRGLILNPDSVNVKIEESFQSDKVTGKSMVSIPVTVEFWSYISYRPEEN